MSASAHHQPTSPRPYGWFDEPGQETPTYNPPIDLPCPFCGKPMSADDVRTHSIAPFGAGGTLKFQRQSYFYRTHRTCAEADDSEFGKDDEIFELIAKNGD